MPDCQSVTCKTCQTREHLSAFVYSGALDIGQFVTTSKQAVILQAIEKHGTLALSPVKQELGDEYTYGEIKMVIADKRRLTDMPR
jgi:ATP-dependent DNA helicase RecQ